MAIKRIFLTGNNEHLFFEKDVQYEFFPGFAISQKQKCIKSLHESIKKMYPKSNPLEVSTKSVDIVGTRLSAFNLIYKNDKLQEKYPVECVFQSAKMFEYGGPYKDILKMTPKDAKRDTRLKTSGNIVAFEYDGRRWPLNPQSLFYDWIYLNALYNNQELAELVMNYNTFTDIEFNYKKSINCQARSVAIYVTLKKRNILDKVINGEIRLDTLY